jgi:hypothetical protein
MVSGFVFVCQEGNAQMFNVWLLIVGVSGVFMLPNANPLTLPPLSLASELWDAGEPSKPICGAGGAILRLD